MRKQEPREGLGLTWFVKHVRWFRHLRWFQSISMAAPGLLTLSSFDLLEYCDFSFPPPSLRMFCCTVVSMCRFWVIRWTKSPGKREGSLKRAAARWRWSSREAACQCFARQATKDQHFLPAFLRQLLLRADILRVCHLLRILCVLP